MASCSAAWHGWPDGRRARRGRRSPQPEVTTFILVRALTYASLFIGLVLVVVPRQFLEWSGVTFPARVGASQLAGIIVCVAGAVLALWCVGTFIVVGRGTPAPFDPPRKLVTAGPYAFVRNPMYIGAAAALAGAALFYGSLWLAVYTAGFLVVTHLFVVMYEEPTLHGMFGAEYAGYCARVRRWLPSRPAP